MLSRLLHENHTELAEKARLIAALLGPPGGHVVLSCKHSQSFVPGLLGAWLAGSTVDLLPNVQAGTLDRVDEDPEITFVLHDDVRRQGRSPRAIYVPDQLAAPANAPAAAEPRAWPQIAVRMTTSGTTERPRY